MFNGWTRDGYWQDGKLLNGKSGRIVYQEPTFSVPQQQAFAEPYLLNPNGKLYNADVNRLTDWQIPTLDDLR